MVNEIRRKANPNDFLQAVMYLANVGAGVESVQEILSRGSLTVDEFVRLSDSDGDSRMGCGDRFAKDPRLLGHARVILNKYALDLSVALSQCSQPPQVAAKTYEQGSLDVVFGDFQSLNDAYKHIASIGPLPKRPDPCKQTSVLVDVHLSDGTTRQVRFSETRSGIGRTLIGPSIEEQYAKFVSDVVSTHPFNDEAAFYVVRDDVLHWKKIADLARMSAFGSVASTWGAAITAVVGKVINSPLLKWGGIGIAVAGVAGMAFLVISDAPLGRIDSEILEIFGSKATYAQFKAKLDSDPQFRECIQRSWFMISGSVR